MRLIDADDLMKAFEALELMSGQYAVSFTNMAGNRSMEIECSEDYISNAKTIDAVPVMYAHWEKADSRFHRRLMQCSNCGNFLDMDGVNCGRGSANYCPNCGAKMDEE